MGGDTLMELSKEEMREIAKVPIETRRYIANLESQNAAMREALGEIANYKNEFSKGYTGGDAFDMQAIAVLANRKAKEASDAH